MLSKSISFIETIQQDMDFHVDTTKQNTSVHVSWKIVYIH